MSLLIQNAIIVNADKKETKEQDILIEKGKITKIGSGLKVDGVKTLDAKGKLVFPGLIDIHVHFREPGQEHKENIETGAKAAVKGGFTTVMCMPNTNPVIDSRMLVEGILNASKRVGLCNVLPIGAITKGQKDGELVDMAEMKEAGCLALSDDGKSVLNSQLMRRAMEYSKMVDVILMEHCEDFDLSAGGCMNESVTSTKLGLKGHAGIAETVIVGRDIELANYVGAKIHMCHMSLKRSVELIRFAKSQGIQVTAEVCPHHFTLTDEAVGTFCTNAKMNPPLRTQEDIEALKEGLKDGTIDCIVTDHAPHTFEEKEVDFDHAPFGIIGLETSAPLTMTELVHPGVLTWEQMADRMSAAPARIVGLENKGWLKEGYDGDVAIIDPNEEWVFTENDIASKSKNTPFIGYKMKGRVKATVFGGKIVYQHVED